MKFDRTVLAFATYFTAASSDATNRFMVTIEIIRDFSIVDETLESPPKRFPLTAGTPCGRSTPDALANGIRQFPLIATGGQAEGQLIAF